MKDSPAKHVIEGLLRMARSYADAIGCLQERYDRPQLVHQAHVRTIVEASSLKSENGPYEGTSDYEYNSLETFVSSIIELKLARSFMFAWQNHSKDQREVPSCTDLLEFVDLHTRTSENTAREGNWKRDSGKISAFNLCVVNIQDSCVACNAKCQCRDFCALSHNRKMAIVKKNALCINCLRPGHFPKNCPTGQRYTECQKPHHLLMHIAPPKREEAARSAKKPSKQDATVVSSHVP